MIDEKYLKGLSFDDNKIFDYKDVKRDKATRSETILKLLTGKKVIHLGACDHIPLIKEKREKGIWLHDCIMDVAEEVVGLDIDESAVKFCNNLGVNNIYCSDATCEICPEIMGGGLDVICR